MALRVVFCLILSSTLLAESGPRSAASVDNDFIHAQFGDSCALEPGFNTMTADLNGDGIEDLVIVARCKNPLIDQDEKNYRVIDPLDSFYGYGNPAITTGFAPDDPKERGVTLLIIHGAGADAWRSETPKAKFVIINLSPKTLTVKKMRIKRKTGRVAIYVEEARGDQMTSVIYWDGKKYRYTPLGSSLE